MGSLARGFSFWAGFFVAGAAAAFAQTVTVDASQSQGAVHPLQQAMWETWSCRGPLDVGLLGNTLGMKLQVSYAVGSDYNNSSPGQYPFVDGDLRNALSVGAHLVINLDGPPGTFNPNPWLGSVPALPYPASFVTAWQQLLTGMFSHIRSIDPSWQYLEMFLEPDGGGGNLNDLLTLYQYVAQAVVQFNASLPAGAPPVLIGGPSAVYWPDIVSWIGSFANMCAANGLPFDFCTWHCYEGAWGLQLSQVPGIIQGCDAAMSQAGFPGRAQLWTECGTNSINAGYSTDGLSSNAAGWAQLAYYAQSSGLDVRPCWFDAWQQNSIMNCSSTDPFGNAVANPQDGTVNPIFNVMQMWSMLKGTGLSTSCDSLPGNGGMGSMDPTGIAVLVWNAGGDGGSSSVNLQVNNLPPSFQGGQIQYQKYQVDDGTSNILNDSSNFLLQEVAQTTLSAGSSYSETVSFNGSGVALIVLTPSGQSPTPVPVPPPNPLPPTPAPPPPSAGLTVGNYYTLTNANSGLDLNVVGASMAEGAIVIQWTHAPGATNAEWQLGQWSDGAYSLRNANSGLYLGVQNDATSAGAQVVQSSPDGSGAHAWTIGQWSSGPGTNSYYLMNPRSGLYLGIQNDSTSAGALVVISSPDGSGAHAWTFVDPPAPGTAAASAAPSAGTGGTGGKAACGLTGLETMFVLGLLALRRRRARTGLCRAAWVSGRATPERPAAPRSHSRTGEEV